MGETGLMCAHATRPSPKDVPLWKRWTCPDCGSEWVADEPAPQMLVEWIPAGSWEWVPQIAKEPWRT